MLGDNIGCFTDIQSMTASNRLNGSPLASSHCTRSSTSKQPNVWAIGWIFMSQILNCFCGSFNRSFNYSFTFHLRVSGGAHQDTHQKIPASRYHRTVTWYFAPAYRILNVLALSCRYHKLFIFINSCFLRSDDPYTDGILLRPVLFDAGSIGFPICIGKIQVMFPVILLQSVPETSEMEVYIPSVLPDIRSLYCGW